MNVRTHHDKLFPGHSRCYATGVRGTAWVRWAWPVTAKPAAKKKSAAQVAAGKKFAAAGRASQASTRAANKKAGKPTRTKAQTQASMKWASAGRSAQAARKAGKQPVSAKKAALPLAQYLGTPILWVPGCIDDLPVCYATAIANSLLTTTGIGASDEDILTLHDHAGGDDGATIANALDAASYHGLAGVKLKTFWQTEEILPGMVVGVQTRLGYHAVLSHRFGLISWGLLMPRFGTPEEAWALEWEMDSI